jgi:ribose/xylose/arabinose/galactoside ABC-type transport system permease subunit
MRGLPRIDFQLATRIGLLGLLFVVFAILESSFATTANVYTVFEGFAFSGLAALGVGITIIAAELDLSVASVAALAGVIAVGLTNVMWPGYAVLIAVAIAAGIGALQGLSIGLLRINSLVFTLGSMIGIRGLVYIVSKERTVILADLSLADVIKHRLFLFSPFSLITLGLFVLVGLFMAYTRWGRDVYALGGGRNEALAAGVPYLRTMVMIFALSAGLAGVAGALVSLKSGSAMPRGLEDLLLPAVTAVLLGGASLAGGKGTVFGIFLGVIVLRFISSFINFRAMPFYAESLATGFVLLLVIAIELLTETPEARQRWQRFKHLRLPRAAESNPSHD